MRYRFLPIILIFAVIAITIHSMTSASSLLFLKKDGLELSGEQARRQHFSLIVDVRTPKERESLGYFPNSIPIDPSGVSKEIPYLLGRGRGLNRKETITSPLLIYSNSGDERARKVAEQLYDLGFIGTRYLKGSYLSMLPPGSQE